jgi:hypothetical protein
MIPSTTVAIYAVLISILIALLYISHDFLCCQKSLQDSKLKLTASADLSVSNLGCVRFWNCLERNGTVPFLGVILVFGFSTEWNQLIPQKGIFP